jgi:hypothetical protein
VRSRLVPERGWSQPSWAALVTGAVASLLVLSSLASADPKPDTSGLAVEPIDVEARPLAGFDRLDAARTRFGKLEWRGGLVLTSPAQIFGGWSGLVIGADGRRFVAVSDAGAWMTGELTYEGARPTGMTNAKTGPLLAAGAGSLKRARDRDAEAMALLDGTVTRGRLLIAFERNHRIGSFEVGERGLGPPQDYLKLPAEARRLKSSLGFEAMAVLRGGPQKGSVVAISERFIDGNGHHSGWLLGRGEAQRFAITDVGGFDMTDAAGLPDGGLLVLERRFRWLEGVKMRLRRLRPSEIGPGTVAAGEVLLEADMGQEIDNMEALGVHTGARGETVITLLSDDNFNSFLQRTVLLQFALASESHARTPDAR